MSEDFVKTHGPPKRERLALTIILGAIGLYAGVLFHWLHRSQALNVTMISQSLLLVFALMLRSPIAIHITLLASLGALWSRCGLWPRFWPFAALVPLIIYTIIVALTPPLRNSVKWFTRGEINRSVWILTGITILLSSSGLLLWFFLVKPDLSRFLPAIPTRNPILLIPIGIGFSLVNAALEESIYRGIMMDALDSVLGLGMNGNALGETTCSWVTKVCEQNRMVRGSVTCQDGTVVLTWNNEIRIFSPEGRLDTDERFVMYHPGQPDGPRDEIVHFADCIRGTCTPVISPEDALRALELTLAARTSAREGRRIEF